MKKRYSFSTKAWLRAGLITAVAFSFSFSLQAQNGPAKLWDKTFGGSEDDNLNSIRQTSDGGYILGGISGSGISGDKTDASKGITDYWVIKLDASGNKLWDKTYGGSDGDALLSLQQTTDGGYILGGLSYSGIGGDKTQACQGDADYWVVKLDASGNKIWDKTFGGSDREFFTALQQTTDGGYILGGISKSGISGDKTQACKGQDDYWLVKLDGSGNKIWDKTIGSFIPDDLNSLQQTSDGGYILGGYSGSGISGDKSEASKAGDCWVVKLNANGDKIWDKSIGGFGDDRVYSLQQTFDGGYILGGTSDSAPGGDKTQASQGGFDYWVVKIDASGNKLWDKTLGGNGFDDLRSLQQTSDGGYILGGYTNSSLSGDKSQACQGDTDYWVVKLDISGNKLWDETIGGDESDRLYSLQQTSDSGYILGGYSMSGINGDKSQANKGPGTSSDFWIVKLGASITGIKEAEAGLAVSIYPNPSQGNIYLQLKDLNVPTLGLTVFDLLGRVVLQQELQVSNQQISQGLTLPSAKGIYLLQVTAGDQAITRKVVVE